mgnify:CR=1 FL=1
MFWKIVFDNHDAEMSGIENLYPSNEGNTGNSEIIKKGGWYF